MKAAPILLLGDTGDSGFAALRTRHFAEAIEDAVVVDFRDEVVAHARTIRPRAVVTASNHGPTRAALAVLAALPDNTPLWLDVAGDPFAEAQAVATFAEDPAAVAAESMAVWSAALARADAFSTVSVPGRYSLLGALGILGRLPLFALGEEPVYVVPCAAAFLDPAAPPRPAGFGVLLLGGFNTWFDEETLLAGLLLAMADSPLTVTVAGGPIVGHHEAGYARFRAGVAASRFVSRFTFPGWVPHAELPALCASHHVTVMLDRPGPEAELGARTRVLYALHQGLRVLATDRSPIVAEAVAARLVERLPSAASPGEACAVDALTRALTNPGAAPPFGLREAWLAERSIARTTMPLQTWAAAPTRSLPAPAAGPLAALHAERDALRSELAALRATPTFRTLDRINRLFRPG